MSLPLKASRAVCAIGMVKVMALAALVAQVPFGAQAEDRDQLGPMECFQLDRSLPDHRVELNEWLSEGDLTVASSAEVSRFPLTCRRERSRCGSQTVISCKHQDLFKLVLTYKLTVDSDKNPGGLFRGDAELFGTNGLIKRMVYRWK